MEKKVERTVSGPLQPPYNSGSLTNPPTPAAAAPAVWIASRGATARADSGGDATHPLEQVARHDAASRAAATASVAATAAGAAAAAAAAAIGNSAAAVAGSSSSAQHAQPLALAPRLAQALPPPLQPDEETPLQPEDLDLQGIAEYTSEIFGQLFRDEALFLPDANYIETQTEINGKMRGILVDWLVEVHMKYRSRPETLYLTINLIDRFLSRIAILRKRLQLVGVVAMFIASKFEEITPPEVADFVYITDNAYTKEDILQMECSMLTALNFHIVVPTAAHFLDRLQQANRSDAVQQQVCRYLVELQLLEIRMIRHLPSHVVAAATLVSNELLGRQPAWPPIMVQVTRYSEAELRFCADELRSIFEAAPNNSLQAVRKRYSIEQHLSVSGMAFPAARPAPRS
jgi:cyclin B